MPTRSYLEEHVQSYFAELEKLTRFYDLSPNVTLAVMVGPEFGDVVPQVKASIETYKKYVEDEVSNDPNLAIVPTYDYEHAELEALYSDELAAFVPFRRLV